MPVASTEHIPLLGGWAMHQSGVIGLISIAAVFIDNYTIFMVICQQKKYDFLYPEAI